MASPANSPPPARRPPTVNLSSTNSLGIPDHPEGRPRMMLNQDLASSNESSPAMHSSRYDNNSDGHSVPTSGSPSDNEDDKEIPQCAVVPSVGVRREEDDEVAENSNAADRDDSPLQQHLVPTLSQTPTPPLSVQEGEDGEGAEEEEPSNSQQEEDDLVTAQDNNNSISNNNFGEPSNLEELSHQEALVSNLSGLHEEASGSQFDVQHVHEGGDDQSVRDGGEDEHFHEGGDGQSVLEGVDGQHVPESNDDKNVREGGDVQLVHEVDGCSIESSEVAMEGILEAGGSEDIVHEKVNESGPSKVSKEIPIKVNEPEVVEETVQKSKNDQKLDGESENTKKGGRKRRKTAEIVVEEAKESETVSSSKRVMPSRACKKENPQPEPVKEPVKNGKRRTK